MANKIILEANTELQDNILRDLFTQMDKKLERINTRTKNHTKEILQLKREIKDLVEKVRRIINE